MTTWCRRTTWRRVKDVRLLFPPEPNYTWDDKRAA